MSSTITIKSIGKGIAEVEEDFILQEEIMSRLVFHAQIHEGGIKGKIIRQRRESKDDKWVPEKAIDIRTLGKNETINLSLDTKAVKELYSAIFKLANILRQKGIQWGENKFEVVDAGSIVITDKNKGAIIQKIIDAGINNEVLYSIANSNPDLLKDFSYKKIKDDKQKIVSELVRRLRIGGFSETTGSDSWQRWIYENNWLFGVNHKNPIEKTKINIIGVMPAFLFPTLDGFVDILEIKLPDDEVIVADPSHAGSWRWTPGANTAIGQVVNYLGEIDRLRYEIEKNIKTAYGYDICLLKPRAYILIGNSVTWSSAKKEGLRKMNNALHGIEVLTYRDLVNRGSQVVAIS